MARKYREFNFRVDLISTLSNDVPTLVEGDTGNIFLITVTKEGAPIDLSEDKLMLSIAKPDGTTCEQDTEPGNGITVIGDNHNILRVELKSGSFGSPGDNNAEVVIMSGDTWDTSITTMKFKFRGRRGIFNKDTLPSVSDWPLLQSALNTLANIARGIQAKWSVTDPNDPQFIQDKPVIGTDIQAATQGLATVSAEIANTASIPVHDTTHKRITWLQVKTWLQTLFDTVYAPLAHKSRHANGQTDALSPADILAAKKSIGFTNYTLAAASWSAGLYTIGTAQLSIISNVVDANTVVEIQPGLGITTAQIQAFQAANVQENAQSAGSIQLKAHGTVPAIDIPIRINVRGDVY